MSKQEKDLTTPISIIVAGAIIALAIYFTMGNKGPAQPQGQNPAQPAEVSGIQADDLLHGNKNAEIKIIEFSDTECPFCKRYHETMKKIVKEYKGKVAWVYRFFPLDNLHPKARTEALAIACAQKIAGTQKAVKYLDRIMEITPSNNRLDLAELPKIAKYVGVDTTAFKKCMDNKEAKARVDKNFNEAIKIGAQGTPHNVIIYKGKQIVIPGGLPYERMKQAIDSMLKEK